MGYYINVLKEAIDNKGKDWLIDYLRFYVPLKNISLI
jgi:hypothetical protein